MSLISNLTNTARTLNAHSAGVEAAGKNIANANDPAYARQRVEYGDRGSVVTSLGPQNLGIEAIGLQQVRDRFLDAQIVSESSRHQSLQAQQLGWQMLQAAVGHEVNRAAGAVGEPGLAAGLAESVDAFFNSFHGLAANPTSGTEKQEVLQQATLLADRIQSMDAKLVEVEASLSGRLESEVDAANTILERIAELNREIERFEVHREGAAVDLRDRRQELLEKLAGHIQVEVEPSATGKGRIDVFVLDAADGRIPLLDRGEPGARLEVDGNRITAGGAEVLPRGGAVLGLQRVSEEGVGVLREELANFTRQLVTSVNEAYAVSGRTFFDPDGDTPDTLRVVETAAGLRGAAEGGEAGSNEAALAVAGLADRAFSRAEGDFVDGRFTSVVADMVASTGQALRRTTAALENQEAVSRLLESQRQSYSGVSVDEEMADLIKFQRAFQASARVMNTVDAMLELIVTRLGR